MNARVSVWWGNKDAARASAFADGYHGLPDGEALEIVDSEILSALRTSGTVSESENLHHYVISTNEGEWCEVVSETVEVDSEEPSPAPGAADAPQ